MSATSARLQVSVTPSGVLDWLTRRTRSAERDLVEHLLGGPDEHLPDLHEFAHTVGRTVPELARAVFVLNRNQGLEVAQASHAAEYAGLDGLPYALAAIIGGQGHAVLADHDGLCVACWGCPESQLDAVCAAAACGDVAPQNGARLYFAAGEFTVAAEGRVDPLSPGWVELGRQLVRWGGPLSGESVVP